MGGVNCAQLSSAAARRALAHERCAGCDGSDSAGWVAGDKAKQRVFILLNELSEAKQARIAEQPPSRAEQAEASAVTDQGDSTSTLDTETRGFLMVVLTIIMAQKGSISEGDDCVVAFTPVNHSISRPASKLPVTCWSWCAIR